MTRFLALSILVFTCTVLAAPARADDPPKKLTAEERKELEAMWKELNGAGIKAYRAGKYPDAITSFEESLKVARRLYNTTEFPDGHNNLASSLSNLATMYRDLGKLGAAEPLCKDALEMYKRLFKGQDHPDLAVSLNNLASLYWSQGRLGDAEPLFKDALEMYKRLFKGHDHPNLATSLNNLAALYWAQGKLSAAELLSKDALEMYRRLFKDQDHPNLAHSLNSLAALYQYQGKHGAAEPLYKDALEMRKRLFKGQNHPDLAQSLISLAALYDAQGKPGDAEPLYKDALEMYKRLFKGQDHPDIATILNNLAVLYQAQGKLGVAEPLYKDALEMNKRLFKGQDHPDIAHSLNSLASLYWAQGKPAAAEPLLKDALEMRRRLFKDHPDLARSLHNLAGEYKAQGKLGAAEPLYKDALEMYRRLAVAFAQDKTEGETLTLLARQPLTRDAYLSTARDHETNPTEVYTQVWADKGYVARAYERRLLQARALATDPKATQTLADLIDARRRRAELLLAPISKDPGTLAQRQQDITKYEVRIEEKTRELKALLPASVRADKLAAANPSDLQKALPADAAVVDFLRFVHFEYDQDKPGAAGETRTRRYLAFVVTKEKVAWVDLDTEARVLPAVRTWRDAITSGKEVPATIPAKVRELVWVKVRAALPPSIKTVYVCPDADLCGVPFAALPGDKPGTVLLEDYALATVPHAPFLLDKLWPQDPMKNPPTEALVVGGVQYDADTLSAGPGVLARGDPLVKAGPKLSWGFLPNTVGESDGVSAAAAARKLPVTRLDGDKATTGRVLLALPRSKTAHFATHGFFADASFRGLFQLDEQDYQRTERGERIGRAVNSPLVMTGLVFAGANQEGTPGRGIITGESLIDLDLSGLELAVLSACETGLGDLGGGGEGVFGLQRAFHYAGTKNVIATLWKIPDEATAALMSLFYRNLWTENLSPLESLRRAQLEIYRNPGKIPALAKEFRGPLKVVAGKSDDTSIAPLGPGQTAPTRLWAAFTLSGPGR